MSLAGSLQRCKQRSGLSLWLLALALLVAPASAQASFPGANGLIAFGSSQRGEAEASYVVNPDGTGLQRLPISGRSQDPAWSADGDELAFTGCQSTECSNTEIYKIGADGTGQVNLTNDPANDWAPAWSPDGAKIAFNSARNSFGVWVMDADGANPIRLTGGENPAWSPDGTKIAFERLASGVRAIYTINPDGTGLAPVTDGTGGDFEPNWSPDGGRIAFSRVTGVYGTCPYNCFPTWDIFTINVDGTGLARLTDNGPMQDRQPAWSPDGTKIAYSRSDQGDLGVDIAVMNADGSGQTKVTNDSPPDFSPDWQPIPYPHPQSADAIHVSLVPSFQSCGTASNPSDSSHAPPLGVASCGTPKPTSSIVRFGRRSVGSADITRVAGDVRLQVGISDVQTPSGSDYDPTSGDDLRLIFRIRVTDLGNCHPAVCSGPYTWPGTGTELDFGPVAVDCVPQGSPASAPGSDCNTDTTANALLPGSVVDGRRALWQAFRVRINDRPTGGGSGALFAQQGVFIP